MKDNKWNSEQVYKLRRKIDRISRSGTIRDKISVCTIATLFFVLADFAKLYVTWTTVQTEAWYFVAILAIASAVILDVPMMVAGGTLKDYYQGTVKKKEMLIITVPAIIAFVSVWLISMWFSIVTKDATFQEAVSADSVYSFSNTLTNASVNTVKESNPSSILSAAVFAGFLPLGTSIASFVISFKMSDSHKEKEIKQREAQLLAEKAITDMDEIIAQETEIQNHKNILISREMDLFNQFVEECETLAQIRLQGFNDALKERCGLNDINEISQQALNDIESQDFSFAPPTATLESITSAVDANIAINDSVA